MKTNKRKLIRSIIVLAVWMGLMVFVVDGLHLFPAILRFFGNSKLLTELVLWVLVLLPPMLAYLLPDRKK